MGKKTIPVNIKIDNKCSFTTNFKHDGNNEPSETSKTVVGTMAVEKDYIQINYSEIDGFPFSDIGQTTLSVCDDVVFLEKAGLTGMLQLAFEQGKKRNCVNYDSSFPYNLCVDTHKLCNGLSKMGGKVYIDYSIEIIGSKFEQNTLSLSIYPDLSVISS